jgi:hypothetical protein
MGERDAGAGAARPLSPAFEAAYDQLLVELAQHADALPNLVCLHWPMHEPSYTGRLLVIGQALNGWGHEGAPGDFADAGERRRQLVATRHSSERDGAFGWMGPRVWSRPFWKLARVAMDELVLRLDQIAWANLAQVAPAAGGNPGGELHWRQHRHGGEMIWLRVHDGTAELLIEHGTRDANQRTYRARHRRRGAIERAFGGPLVWAFPNSPRARVITVHFIYQRRHLPRGSTIATTVDDYAAIIRTDFGGPVHLRVARCRRLRHAEPTRAPHDAS